VRVVFSVLSARGQEGGQAHKQLAQSGGVQRSGRTLARALAEMVPAARA
jgi:hypothetical protein